MENVLKGIQPEAVFRNFEAISQIPRESGNEEQISNYLVQFGKDLGLEVIQEESGNVIIKKPGTKGYENTPTVILQGHMDMVCVKKEGFEFVFAKDPIPLVVDGDFVKTKGTTLGADNGIAVAMSMAILESNDMEHPPLECLITVEEETGMDGVMNLRPEHISGKILINIDSEEEGTMLASCAGGVRNIVRIPIEWKEVSKGKQTYLLGVKGLRGGHSGSEIDKNRASAIKLLGRVLRTLQQSIEFDIASVSGGEKMNAIPKMAYATLVIDEGSKSKLEEIVSQYQDIFHKEFEVVDPEIQVLVSKAEPASRVFQKKTTENFIHALRLIPYGVQTMSGNIQGLVESSNNIGTLDTNENEILLSSAVRSSVKSLKDEINDRINSICELTDAKMELNSDYPAWEFEPNSKIRGIMNDVYQEMNHKEMKVDAIHAGLECGFLQEKLGKIDIVSIGPNIYNAHTPEESLSISSTQRVYEFLVEVLKKIK
ncbi:aminoacyl-histidine dipeptidase [Tepidibacillus marianensis]|uniref:aminoacyl-histidine dipeptidase n=1 Tax=Tepidibacillus marianensis TaxID=3131995 RepID=UPI0030CE7508